MRPAFAHKVMAVALTEWLVETRERLVEKLISFFIGGSLFTPRGWFSYHISSQSAANWNSALHSGCNFKSKKFESRDLLLVLYIFLFLLKLCSSENSPWFFSMLSLCVIDTKWSPFASTSNLKLLLFKLGWPSKPRHTKTVKCGTKHSLKGNRAG